MNVRYMQGKIDLLTGENDLVKQQLTQATIQAAQKDSDYKVKADQCDVLMRERNQLSEKYASLKLQANEELNRLQALAKDARAKLAQKELEFQQLMDQFQGMKSKFIEKRKECEQLMAVVEGKDSAIAEYRQTLETRDLDIRRTEIRMKRALKLQGYLTHAKALQSIPKFKPLAERRRPIISVLNLKGGVGKTTITAHLAGAFARKGYRVLMVDLDLQGSLSAVMLGEDKIYERSLAKKLLQDFFRQTNAEKVQVLADYAVKIEAQAVKETVPGSMHIVPCTDALAYAELNLTLSWLLRRGKRDARFLLRKAIHDLAGMKDYDLILLDCPPLLSMSCVNALAASDYLLCPTLLTRKAAERAPKLFEIMNHEEFKRYINCNLKVLGMVASRASQRELKGNDAAVWGDLPRMILTAQLNAVKQFNTVIAQSAEIAAGEERYSHPKSGSAPRVMFDSLANEIEEDLPYDCRIIAPATSPTD